MWKAVVLTAALLCLIPARAAAQLSLANARVTYANGLPRESNKILQGDIYYVTYEVENLKVEEGSGRAFYSMSMKVVDSKGDIKFSEKAEDMVAVLGLGGTVMPVRSQVTTGLDLPPGKYTMHVTVADKKAKVEKELKSDFVVLPKAFGMIRLSTTIGDGGKNQATAPPTGYVGQWLGIEFGVVGMKRDTKKQFKVSLTARILDDKGNPTSPKTPFVGEIPKDLGEDVKLEDINVVPVGFLVSLNRPGNYTVEVEAVDHFDNKKSVTARFPLTVLDLKSLKPAPK